MQGGADTKAPIYNGEVFTCVMQSLEIEIGDPEKPVLMQGVVNVKVLRSISGAWQNLY